MVEEREERMVVEDELAPKGVERRMGRDERSDRLARVVVVAASRADEVNAEGERTRNKAERPGMCPALCGWARTVRGWAGCGHHHRSFSSQAGLWQGGVENEPASGGQGGRTA